MRTLVVVAMALLAAGRGAAAQPPDYIAFEPEPVARWGNPTIEWSTWFRLGYGGEVDRDPAAARDAMPAPMRGEGTIEAAFGADLTLPIARRGDVRLGPWAEARTSSRPVGGIELQLGGLPGDLDMFFWTGEGVLTLRAGANDQVVTGALSWGYRCPWNLRGGGGTTLYMIGVRVVASYTRAIDDPHDWTATIGLETEPVGALRYLLGIRSWY
jgi:hypothetical protein